ncbi:ATP-binding protein [Streptomyces sp. 1-11]|uniref:ATP-binding protein n=1 Tax=Streptomyces sp. 1-11 TaxID=2590549 RepID=UPI00117CABA8|nr:ATP-binding protein [Streptomyces sp. 1-11]
MPHTRIHFDLEAAAAAVRDARHRISAAVKAWGALDDEASFRLEVVVAELLTISLLHANSPIAIDVALDQGFLVVSVLDGSSAAPRTCEAGAGDERGRGRALIEALSLFHGIEFTASGKRCWAVLPSAVGPSPVSDAIADSAHTEIDLPSSVRWSLTPLGKKMSSSLPPPM